MPRLRVFVVCEGSQSLSLNMQLKNRRKLEASLGTLVVRHTHHTHT